MKEQKWNLANNAKQIQAAQKDCLAGQRRDDLTMPPFEGPIGKYPRCLPNLSNKNGRLPIDIENDLSNKILFVFRRSITFNSFTFAMFYFFPFVKHRISTRKVYQRKVQESIEQFDYREMVVRKGT